MGGGVKESYFMQILNADFEMFTIVSIFRHIHIVRAPDMDEGGVYSKFFEMEVEREGVGLEMLGAIPFINYEP